MTTRDQKSYLLPNPPSHILSNGHFVYLPEPTKHEKALFFQQSIVVHNIVSAQKLGGTAVDDDEEQVDAEEGRIQKSPSTKSEVKIHPLAIAAARIEALGISQLSKSINLGNLIGTEYFDTANIVSPEGVLPASISAKNKSASNDSEARKKASVGREGDVTYGKSDFTAQQLLDQRLRSTFLLKRKYSQLVDAAEFLGLHKRRLEGSLDRQRLIDRRYLQLRKQWRLAAPEHGTRVSGPVRSNEVIAIDVETYDRDRFGGTYHLPNEARRRLARLVPRYVTIELEPPPRENIKELESSITVSIENCDPLKQPDSQPMDVDVKEEVPNDSLLSGHESDQNRFSVTHSNGKTYTAASKSQLVTTLSEKLNLITKAEPYAVADPTLGKLDLEFNPDKVPIWTLQLSLKKNSTGFSVSSTLSPVTSLTTDDDVTSSAHQQKEESGKVKSEEPESVDFGDPRFPQKDEKVIQSLQHSLFCASIFDAIRNEIRTANSSGSSGGSSRPTVWLSSETDEMFFPPTLLMANSPGYHPCKGGKLGFCVSYCQEGEVAVQLDQEYVLTIKLIEVGTATEASKMQEKLHYKPNGGMRQGDNLDFTKAHDSGSQTPEQLYTLCRALLLQVQFLYHDFRKKHPYKNKASSLSTSRPSATNVCARILEKCVAFGSKVLFEKKVVSVLYKISSWLKNDHPDLALSFERLPLSFFDFHAHFAMSIGCVYSADLHIRGGSMSLTTFFASGLELKHTYQTVVIASDEAFECHLKYVVNRILRTR